MKLISFLLICSISALTMYNYLSLSHNSADFDYVKIDCKVFSTSGKILYYQNDTLCAFADDGKILSSTPNFNILRMTDKNNEILWTSEEVVHHDLKFTSDQKAFLAISTEIAKFDNINVRSDCFSKRDLNNKIISEWCLSKNIEKLIKLGFVFQTKPADKFSMNNFSVAQYEISHSNSIYEIKNNSNSLSNEAFKEGNFIVNLHIPLNAILILDQSMKKILWYKNVSHILYGSDYLKLNVHDVQVTEDGKILMYINFHQFYNISLFANYVELPNTKYQNPNWNSSLIKIDPISGSINWLYQSDPKFKFRSKVSGSVTELHNKNLLFSDITNPVPAISIVDLDKNTIWEFKMPQEKNESMVVSIQKAKPMYNPAFLKARGLID